METATLRISDMAEKKNVYTSVRWFFRRGEIAKMFFSRIHFTSNKDGAISLEGIIKLSTTAEKNKTNSPDTKKNQNS